MTPAELQAYLITAEMLFKLGRATALEIAGFFKDKGATNAQLNEVLRTLITDAQDRLAVSQEIANGESPE